MPTCLNSSEPPAHLALSRVTALLVCALLTISGCARPAALESTGTPVTASAPNPVTPSSTVPPPKPSTPAPGPTPNRASWALGRLATGLYPVSVNDGGLRVRDLEGDLLGEVPQIIDPGAAISVDGRFVAFRGAGEASLMVMDLDTLAVTEVAPDSGLFFGPPTWSPDDKFLVASGEDPSGDRGSLYRIQLDTGTITRLTFWPSAEVAPAWSPDGRWIAFASDHYLGDQDGPNELYLYDTSCTDAVTECAERSRRLTHEAPSGQALQSSWSADSRQLVYECPSSEEFDLCVLDIRTGSRRHIAESSQDETTPIWSPDGQWMLFNRYSDPFDRSLMLIRPDGTGEHELATGDDEASTGWILLR